MHQLLHIGVLASTLLGAAAAMVLLLWPLLADSPLPRAGKISLIGLFAAGALLLFIELRFVH
ncbi:MAG: hypothetical protein M3N53_02840 [Actinomycetota bacterium]|nr:hypothetical protein [Actinomycetota bacterium]